MQPASVKEIIAKQKANEAKVKAKVEAEAEFEAKKRAYDSANAKRIFDEFKADQAKAKAEAEAEVDAEVEAEAEAEVDMVDKELELA